MSFLLNSQSPLTPCKNTLHCTCGSACSASRYHKTIKLGSKKAIFGQHNHNSVHVEAQFILPLHTFPTSFEVLRNYKSNVCYSAGPSDQIRREYGHTTACSVLHVSYGSRHGFEGAPPPTSKASPNFPSANNFIKAGYLHAQNRIAECLTRSVLQWCKTLRAYRTFQ